tara:strand:- start:2417 stop:3007 length:591 start_codon:yes stop_codon:yes gene_type:complete
MHVFTLVLYRFLACLLMSVLLVACGNSESDVHHHGSDQHSPDHVQNGHDGSISSLHINKSDECHLCGMVIQQFAGPKGLLEEKHPGAIRKFCSTNDFFSYVLQPENQHNIQKIYVHDMSEVEWSSPQDEKMIEADQAWYVAEHDLQGAMGPTIASFKTEVSAQNFQKKQGGYLLRFSDINLELMSKLMQMPMHSHH